MGRHGTTGRGLALFVHECLACCTQGLRSDFSPGMTALSEHAATPVPAAAHRMRGFVWGTALSNRSNASLWLAKAYKFPLCCMAVRFGAQIPGRR